jgi:uridine kinase
VQVPEIASVLAVLRHSGETTLVAIDGPGGSGKTVLAESLRMTLERANVSVHIIKGDDFFLPSASRPCGVPSEKPIGGDFDWCRLRHQVLEPLRRGQTARYDRYDWLKDELTVAREVPPGGVVLVEGVYSSRREIADLYDMRLWVECPRERRLARGLERDGEAARKRWEEDWMPSEDQYIREHRPHEYADAIVNGDAV